MGLLLLNQHDAFLSYARDDDVLNDQAVTQFKPLLKKRFEAEMRRRLDLPDDLQADIFMDREGLPSNGDLSHELTNVIESTIFLFIFVGSSYPRSTWCGRELQHFMQKFNGDRQAALDRTFIIVLERQAMSAKWGHHLEQPTRPLYEEFFDDVTGRVIPFVLDEDGRAVQSPRFTARLRRVVDTMANRAVALTNLNSAR